MEFGDLLTEEQREQLIDLAEGGTGEKRDRKHAQDADPVHKAVREIMLQEKVKTFDKHRQVASLAQDYLASRGSFYRTQDGRLFYFGNENRQLIDIEQRFFTRFLTYVFNISLTEAVFRFVHDFLQAHVAHEGVLTEVHTLSHYNQSTGLLAVSNGGGGIWAREIGGRWEERKNGDDGLLFLTDPDASPWVPDFGKGDGGLAWFLNAIPFENPPLSEDNLEREDFQMLLLVWLLHQFFPCLRRTRMIPAFLGPHGSGKTTTCRQLGRLLVGDKFEVSGLRREKEDAFIASVTNRVVYAVDNADTKIDWLEDTLARYATGEKYRMRRLYSTNEEASYSPRAILLLTSRDPHFHRPDISERLLPFPLVRLEQFLDEESLYQKLINKRGSIWGDILIQGAQAADHLAKTQAPPLQFRMADYASFGWRILRPLGAEAAWLEVIQKLDRSQMVFAGEGDGMISALGALLESEAQIGPISVRDLYCKVREVADSQGFSAPKTVDGFGRKLTTMSRIIEMELGVTCSEDRGHGRKRWITLKRKTL